MPAPSGLPSYRNPGWFLALPAVLLLAVLIWVSRRGEEASLVPRRTLLVMLPPAEGEPLSPGEQRAFTRLLKDLLEVQGRRSVSSAPVLPQTADAGGLGPAAVVAFTVARQGMSLSLTASAFEVGATTPGPWRSQAPTPPWEAIHWLLGQVPGPRIPADERGLLVPRPPAAFWALLSAASKLESSGDTAAALAFAEACEAEAPGCATASLLRGQCLAYRAMEDPKAEAGTLEAARAQLEEALRRMPHHPRASQRLAGLLLESGRTREGLLRARALLQAHPHAQSAHQALAFAGRHSGLLQWAAQGHQKLEEGTVDRHHPPRVQVGLLYLGQWEAFERSLWLTPGDPADVLARFHLGHLELERNRPAQALLHFRALQADSGQTFPRYRALGGVFHKALSGRTLEAMTALRTLDQEREGLRAPDGEFTFMLAEAYAFLGQRELALELGTRAFAQGFACTSWYEQSPLLASLKGLPRWTALLQALRDRQAHLEGQFPPSELSR